jgi:hypothetical protein
MFPLATAWIGFHAGEVAALVFVRVSEAVVAYP